MNFINFWTTFLLDTCKKEVNDNYGLLSPILLSLLDIFDKDQNTFVNMDALRKYIVEKIIVEIDISRFFLERGTDYLLVSIIEAVSDILSDEQIVHMIVKLVARPKCVKVLMTLNFSLDTKYDGRTINEHMDEIKIDDSMYYESDEIIESINLVKIYISSR